MSEDNEEFDPAEHEAREVAQEAAQDQSKFLSLMPHYYRGEVSQMSTRLDRLDLTIDWAVAVIAAMLALSFGSADNPPYFLLIGMFAMVLFLLFDVRRYRAYDAARARVRMVEQNLFANAFSPDGTEHEGWRKEIGDDLRYPTLKVSYREAVSRRLRRVYLPLLTILLVAWVFRITIFVPGESWLETAAIPGVPPEFVVAAVGVFYLAMAALTLLPTSREAKGEFYDQEAGDWKTDSE